MSVVWSEIWMWIRPRILHTRDVSGDSGGRQTAAAPTQVPARVIIKSKHWRGDLVPGAGWALGVTITLLLSLPRPGNHSYGSRKEEGKCRDLALIQWFNFCFYRLDVIALLVVFVEQWQWIKKETFQHNVRSPAITVTERPIFTEAVLCSRDELLDTAGPGRGHQLTISPLLQGQWSNECLHVSCHGERMPSLNISGSLSPWHGSRRDRGKSPVPRAQLQAVSSALELRATLPPLIMYDSSRGLKSGSPKQLKNMPPMMNCCKKFSHYARKY